MGVGLFGVARILFVFQAGLASVTGTVRDGGSGDPVARAIVTLTDLERSVATDDSGRYTFEGVSPGPHHLTVRRIGYAPRTLHALVPREGAVEINIALRPEPITLDAISARVAVPVRGLDHGDHTAFPDRELSQGAVRDHPLLAEPDVFQALSGGEVVVRPESPSGLHVRGGESDQVAYLLDGIPVFSPYHTAGTFSGWNPDVVSRLLLTSSAPAGDALSGVVTATTRAPGSNVRTQGGVSTTHARVTLDGPLGSGGAGFLWSMRSGFPGYPAPKRESSYLLGETSDWLAKVESPLFGGRARVLGYESTSEMGFAAIASEGPGAPAMVSSRNSFSWRSRSIGGAWTRQLGRLTLDVRAWRALGSAGALWRAHDSLPERLAAGRRDDGLLVTMQVSGAGATTTGGMRAQRSRTYYRSTDGGRVLALSGETPVAAAFIEHGRALTGRTQLELGLTGAWAAGDFHLSPRAGLRWTPSGTWSFSGGYARVHQFAQSLRNAESVVGGIFPADLYVGAGTAGVPVATSDQGIVAAEYRPTAGIRFAAQAYARNFDGLVMVAPRDADPFATSGFLVGSGVAHGAVVELAANGARYGIVASYGVQRVRRQFGDTGYIPDHGAAHAIDAGVILYPSATFSVRLGGSGVLGRRVTAVAGPFEWEACNLLDRGCELAGSPHDRPEPLGATSLPAYVRVDLGVRKHWHLRLGGRDGQVAVFGTLTNVFGRRNVLTVAVDPLTGARSGVDMRPRAPLVVGIDWRF